MARPPRSQKPHVKRPSPLQQVQHTRPLSMAPTTPGLVRDPQFWKRFSVAVHMADIPLDDIESGTKAARTDSTSSTGILEKEGNEWLAQQAKERRQYRITFLSITVILMMVIIAVAIVGWYFANVKKTK